ncbi:hypothetical protein UFOVP1670_37 [uncultured Caudovirales phage]|uniref:Uncharacterized protein n=1 Tax=uncultured Caudovirales phage TaxID=2100421 RepID=A0A6J5T766_9CAUD|nr:hypothetical protein UFOVP1670_37 [uncultured Caudovirales phage]
MPTLAVLQYVMAFMDGIPKLIAAGTNIAAAIQEHKAKVGQMVLEKRDPTPAEWDAVNAEIQDLRSELQKG